MLAGVRMKIRIDRERCMGSGSCQHFAPHTFDLDGDCKVVLLAEQGDPPTAIQNAAESCPTRAITIDEESGAR
jgi:ferredoxin